ncbi:Carbohydrate-binding protein, partial [Globisporangium polare]
MVDSAYYYLLDGNSQTQTDLSAVKVALTSKDGQVITETVTLTAGSCTEGTLQFATVAGTGNTGADADTVFALQVESVEPTPSPETLLSDPLQAASEPPVVDTTTTMATATGSDHTPAPVVTIVPAPASGPPSSAPTMPISSAPVLPPAAATAPVASPHPSVHRCKVKHTSDHMDKDDAKHKHKDY